MTKTEKQKGERCEEGRLETLNFIIANLRVRDTIFKQTCKKFKKQ